MAQNQHYVPQFILRQFLCDEAKEQVHVYDKHEEKIFTTSIRNIMAENKFHDLHMEKEEEKSFEPIATQLEKITLPTYQRIIDERRLTNSEEERLGLALLLSFQFVRTKSHRHFRDEIDAAIMRRIIAMGKTVESLEGGYKPITDDATRKREHILSMIAALPTFTEIILRKDFLLAEAAEGKAFYLGDNPVSLNNTKTFGPYGNLGLEVPGIEIYLPLSASLTLCAWCPSILREIFSALDLRKKFEAEALQNFMTGKMDAAQMKNALNKMKPHFANAEGLKENFESGTPISSNQENMDHYNSLQSMYAYRYVVAPDGDFDLAQRHNREFPKFRKGHRPRAD